MENCKIDDIYTIYVKIDKQMVRFNKIFGTEILIELTMWFTLLLFQFLFCSLAFKEGDYIKVLNFFPIIITYLWIIYNFTTEASKLTIEWKNFGQNLMEICDKSLFNLNDHAKVNF